MNRSGLLPQFLLERCLSLSTMDSDEVVILVVGNDLKDTANVVDTLAQGDAWSKRRTAAGTRVLRRESPPRVIVEPTILRSISGKSPVATARRWISQNSLRRILFGKLVFVVCVVKCDITKERCNWDIFFYSNCWVDVFGLIFPEQKGAIMMLVNTEGNPQVQESEPTKMQVKRFVKEHGFSPKNIVYSDFGEGDDAVRRVVEESVSLGEVVWNKRPGLCSPRSFISMKGSSNKGPGFFSLLPSFRGFKNSFKKGLSNRESCSAVSCVSCFSPRQNPPDYINLVPSTSCGLFRMQEVSSKDSRFGPWGPERVILFGRTGSGKSTLAQMLTLGRLDAINREFATTSSIRGGTKEIEPGEGRGWYVVDTPGFGEPKGQDSTITTREAENKIKKYVKNVEGTFSHYLYVVRKDRLDLLEERLWRFFVQLFGEEIKHQFSVVLSGADDDWVQANLSHLQECFHGCSSFLSAEFPATVLEDDELENEWQKIRTDALHEFEDRLASLGRSDLHCKYGDHSKMHQRNERERAHIDMRIEKDIRIKILAGGANVVFGLSDMFSHITSPISQLTSLLRVDDNISLMPL